MKKLSLIFTVAAGLFISFAANAQTTPPPPPAPAATAPANDYFPGKWNIVVKGHAKRRCQDDLRFAKG